MTRSPTRGASRQLSSKSTPDVLKQDAKRWLTALRANDPDARRRLTNAWLEAPAEPTLRDVQHALAREYGYADWRAVLVALEEMALDRQSRAERVEQLLRHGWDNTGARARRLLARDPSLVTENLWTAATCGDVEAVRRVLAADPEAASRTGGPMAWTALSAVCYGRVDDINAVTIATLLLDAGADPSVSIDDGWGNPFTPITGAIGLGEGVKPSHPQARALVDLLLARGANPFDTQALYNDSIAFDDPYWMDRLWQACAAVGRTADWSQTEGPQLGGKIKVGTLNYLLGNAVTNRHVARVRWLLEHGADARTRHSYTQQPVHTVARLAGFTAVTALLEAHGAIPDRLSPSEQLVAALASGDEVTARALLAEHPAPTHRAHLLALMASRGQARAVTLLLELGADPHLVDHEGATALHRAAQSGSVDTVAALLAAGADVNRRDARWQGTPLSWAVVLHKRAIIEYLVPVSRDVRALTRLGRVERLEAVLAETPALANHRLTGVTEPTPLFCLPEDAALATEVVRVLLTHGADPMVRDAKGHTAELAARQRGLDEAADVMRDHAR